jgi:hypothetical protein
MPQEWGIGIGIGIGMDMGYGKWEMGNEYPER